MTQEEFEKMPANERARFLAERRARYAPKDEKRVRSSDNASGRYFDLENFSRGFLPLRAKDPDFYKNEVDPHLLAWRQVHGNRVPLEEMDELYQRVSRETATNGVERRGLKLRLARVAAGLAIPVALSFVWLIARSVTASEKRQFDALTPAGQHLAKAKDTLAEGAFEEGLREIKAIPASTPEAASAKEVEDRLNAGLQAAVARAAQKRAEVLKNEQIHSIEVQLRELGYKLSVSASNKSGEIAISLDDFSDTDHRVRFLAFIRSQKGPAQNLCWLGISEIRLTGQGFLGSFRSGDAYSLECWR
jgi:hypothetical protein